jgi:hypothetical protein
MSTELSTENAALPEITDSRELERDTILTKDQRKQMFRAALVGHQKEAGLRLKQFVLGKRRYIRTLDLIPRRKRAEDVDVMCRYFNADQYGRYNDLGMYEDKRQEGDYAYAIPILSGHVEQAFIQLLKIRPEYNATANDANDPTMGLVADMCEKEGVKELKRVMDPVTHSELYNMLLGGDSLRFVGWEPNKLSPKVINKPIHKATVRDIPARRECADCKESVDRTVCPKCGSANITEIPAGKVTSTDIVGHEEVELGENCVHIPHMLSIQCDMSAVEPEDSTFLVEYSYIDKHVAQWEFQSQIEETKEGLPIEMQLRFDLERGSNQTDAIIGSARLLGPGREGVFGTTGAGSGMALPNRKQPLERHYWDPSEYGHYYCAVDEQLPNGKIIRAGTLLGDYFPKGARLITCGDSIMDIDDYVWRRKVTRVRYGRIAGTNRGAGLQKLIPLQDAGNDNFNLSQTVKHTVGHPLTVINGRFVSELPGAGNVLKVTNAGVQDVGSVVKQYPGQSMSQADGADQIIQGAMQFIAGTSTIGGSGAIGAPDMRAAGTATGVAAMQEQQAARQSGPAGQRISADMEMIIQLLENIQEFSTPEQKDELRKRYGRDVADAFFQCNLRQSVTIGMKANTDMPRSMALTQANYLAFGNILGQIVPGLENPDNPLAEYIKEFLDDMATAMGFPFSMGTGRRDRREAGYRLNLLNDIETQLTAQQPELLQDPIQFAAAMHSKLAELCMPLIATDDSQTEPGVNPSDLGVPRVLMQDHVTFMDVYTDALFGEQSKSWSRARRLCVIQLWLDHAKAKMSKTLVEGQLQAEVEQMLNPEPPPAAGATGPTPQETAQQTQLEAANEAHMAAGQHESDRQTKDEDLDRAIQLNKAETDDKIRLAQAEASLEPPPPEPEEEEDEAAVAEREAQARADEHQARKEEIELTHKLGEKSKDADVGRKIKVEKAKPRPVAKSAVKKK